MSPTVAAIQQELVDVRINIVRILQDMAGDCERSGKTATPDGELQLWRAKEALAEARIDLARVELGE